MIWGYPYFRKSPYIRVTCLNAWHMTHLSKFMLDYVRLRANVTMSTCHHVVRMSSPTCQARVVRFHVSWRAFLLLLLFPCSLPDLNSNLWIKVTPAGPPPQAPDQSVSRRTFIESSGSECSSLDLHRKLRIKAFLAGPPPQAQKQSFPLPDLNHK